MPLHVGLDQVFRAGAVTRSAEHAFVVVEAVLGAQEVPLRQVEERFVVLLVPPITLVREIDQFIEALLEGRDHAQMGLEPFLLRKEQSEACRQVVGRGRQEVREMLDGRGGVTLIEESIAGLDGLRRERLRTSGEIGRQTGEDGKRRDGSVHCVPLS